jgi:outer membrane receptor protein involved in Fe transport
VDPNAPTTETVYESLGRPDYIAKTFDAGGYVYRYVIDPALTYNAHLAYRFGAGAPKWADRTTIRLGVINLTDEAPPFSSGNAGYADSVYGTLLAGRTWTFEITKAF